MPFIDASHYQHDLDRQALAALKSIPGFTALLKAFMKVYNERIAFISTKSTHVEITPHQLSEYYDMVPPICEKLGIDVPALYLANDGEINAYTTNETSPIIVMNAGVIQNCSEDTVRAIFAHECGHIASHHVMYHMMGDLITSGAAAVLPGVGGLVTIALQAAYLKWNRASEYTADRAAAIALGEPEAVENMCVELAGAWECLDLRVDTDLFMQQAAEYEQAIQGSTTNKVFEIILHSLEGTHPLNAYRALELRRFCATDDYENMQRFLRGEHVDVPASMPQAAAQPQTDGSQLSNAAAYQAPPAAVAQASGDPSFQAPNAAASFCTNCGSPLKEGQKFCRSCGSRCE